MRRERFIAALAVVSAVLGTALLAPGSAGAATPQQICTDLLANGHLTQTYSADDLQAYFAAQSGGDATIQGYCPPLVVTPQCVQVSPGTPGAVQAQNGTWFTNAPNGNAEACTTPPSPCTAVPANTPGAAQASNGAWFANAPGGDANACTRQEQSEQPAAVVTVPTTGVKGATKTKQSTPAASAPAQRTATPLATTTQSSTLPFTGAQLTIFVVVGLALVGGGLALSGLGRRRFDS